MASINPKTPQKPSSLRTPSKPQSLVAKSKVRVVARVRPFLDRVIDSNDGNWPVPCVSVIETTSQSDEGGEVTVHLKDPLSSRNECYKLDAFFGLKENNVVEIFNKEVSPLIPEIFQGHNACVFACGATGSGKTYTIQGTDDQPGLMIQSVSRILSISQSTRSTVEISYYEVYLDKCLDLLEAEPKEVTVLDDKDGVVHLRGLSRVPIGSMFEFHKVYFQGILRRKVGSHVVLVIGVSDPSPDGLKTSLTGKLSFIDLAGYEDNRRTGNEGTRQQETTKVNQSLFALSKVIQGLNNNQPRIPYRESKLTRILQDSLGGTSYALMVACLNSGDYQGSLHTVSLAAPSRRIYNFVSSAQKHETPKVKVDMQAKLRDWLESTGKTKSSQKRVTFGSPLFRNTPGSVGTLKRQVAVHSSAKSKASTNVGVSSTSERSKIAPQRKLFNYEAVCNLQADDAKDRGSGNQKESVLELGATLPDEPLDKEDNMLRDVEANSMQPSPVKFDIKDDFPGGVEATYSMQPLPVTLQDKPEKSPLRKVLSPSNDNMPRPSLVEPLENDENLLGDIEATNLMKQSSVTSNDEPEGSPLRKALSPINGHMPRPSLAEFLTIEKMCLSPLDPQTPKRPFVMASEESPNVSSALDKFHARSSNLKSRLEEEYIDFLNTASKEELVVVKGIGQKRAEYIIELREKSPLKSLNDLEKLGLSSKQVNNLFGSAARGMF